MSEDGRSRDATARERHARASTPGATLRARDTGSAMRPKTVHTPARQPQSRPDRSAGDAHATLLARVRREFFARGASLAIRYGVTPEEVIAHLERADLASTPGPGRVLSFIDDLIGAVACCRGHPQAWYDTWARHESFLIRASRMRLSEGDAVIFARRFWIELHAVTVLGRRLSHDSPVSASLVTLAHYSGVRPIRIWLTDRLLGTLESALRDAMARRVASDAGRPSALTARAGASKALLAPSGRQRPSSRRLPAVRCEPKFAIRASEPSYAPIPPLDCGDERSAAFWDSFWSGKGEARLRLVD